MKKGLDFFFAVILSLGLGSVSVYAGPTVDLETGLVFSGYNDIGIPGDTGTRFSLHDGLEPENSVFLRLRLGYTFADRHNLSLLAAPLTVRYSGELAEDVDFAGETFLTGTGVDVDYKFNSYRLTYRYELYESRRLEFGLGLTGKIRDAEIRFKSSSQSAKTSNVGFVPLVNFRLFYRPQKNIGFLVEGDALASVQGRAEDVLFAFVYDLSDRWNARIGYRILEGGADNDKVYSFALFNYTIFGIQARF